MRPSKRAIQAMASLTMNEDFKVVMEWIRDTRDQERAIISTHKDETLMRWSQGRDQALSELLKTLDTARDTLNRMN